MRLRLKEGTAGGRIRIHATAGGSWRASVLAVTRVFPALAALAFAPAPAVAQSGPLDATPPAWVVDGVPDTVWVLVEGAIGAADSDLTKELLKEAEGHARTALTEHEADVGRRFALAVVLGLRADREGGKTKVGAASELHKELEAILALEPEHARARHMLGRLHAGVLRMNRVTRWLATNLLGGGELKKATWEEAERNLVFAENRVPEVTDHHLQLANLYRDTKRPELALIEVEHVLALPVGSPMERAVFAEALRLKERLADSGGR
jgi:hypothetical protein